MPPKFEPLEAPGLLPGSLPDAESAATGSAAEASTSERGPSSASVGKAWFATFGCQMNVLDSELTGGEMRRIGYELVDDPADASVLVFNTCSVRQLAEDKVWSALGRLKGRKAREPELIIAVIGCMAQRDGAAILERAPHVDLVVGTRGYHKLPELIATAQAGERVLFTDESVDPVFTRDVTERPSSFQAYVTVVRGCNMSCTYCIVPAVRGREVSRPIDEVADEVRMLVDDGVREVTLLGQNVDAYGHTLGKRGMLADLLEAIHEIDGLDRIRFVTSHPRDIHERLLTAIGDLPKVGRFLHMPAQSGSDRMLKAMRRGYTVDRYRTIVDRARELVPDVEIMSDFIVGFPGETDEDFDATEALVREIGFQTSYVFKYSVRPGTPAAELEDDVPTAVKKERNARLLAAQEETAGRRNERWRGRTVQVLVEGRSKTVADRLQGRASTNHIVAFSGAGRDLTGRMVDVRVDDSTWLSLRGEVVAVEGQPLTLEPPRR